MPLNQCVEMENIKAPILYPLLQAENTYYYELKHLSTSKAKETENIR